MPNLDTSAALVESATKCFGDRALVAAEGRRVERSQSRAVWALVSVSSVVNVFDATMKSVSSGSRSRVFSAKSLPSTLETKRETMSRCA